jgi:DNA-binding response OmpR family regulator
VSDHRPRILVVADEPRILAFLVDNLRDDDMEVFAAQSLAQARSKLNAVRPDLVVLDVNLPDGNGFDFCREIRAWDPLEARFDLELPILMLTARTEEVDRVRGFQRGADDFLGKPYSYPELLARINALLRRAGARAASDVLHSDGIAIDLRTREVRVNGAEVQLSSKEFLLLAALARDPLRVHAKHELLEKVWGYRASGATRTLDAHASRLRRKLRPLGDGRAYIGNIWGVGYRLVGVESAG